MANHQYSSLLNRRGGRLLATPATQHTAVNGLVFYSESELSFASADIGLTAVIHILHLKTPKLQNVSKKCIVTN